MSDDAREALRALVESLNPACHWSQPYFQAGRTCLEVLARSAPATQIGTAIDRAIRVLAEPPPPADVNPALEGAAARVAEARRSLRGASLQDSPPTLAVCSVEMMDAVDALAAVLDQQRTDREGPPEDEATCVDCGARRQQPGNTLCCNACYERRFGYEVPG